MSVLPVRKHCICLTFKTNFRISHRSTKSNVYLLTLWKEVLERISQTLFSFPFFLLLLYPIAEKHSMGGAVKSKVNFVQVKCYHSRFSESGLNGRPRRVPVPSVTIYLQVYIKEDPTRNYLACPIAFSLSLQYFWL